MTAPPDPILPDPTAPGPGSGGPLDDPAQCLALGLQLAGSRAGGLALDLAGRALARHGDDPLWQAVAAAIRQSEVPDFHGDMLRDGLRNAAYRAAIERFAPGRSVLDIGTGSGLLAMMAARAGAARVYACEANPMLAASARAVIAANGLTDRIRVFDCHSSKLDRTRDLGGGVDLVVSEVFCETLVGEGALSALAHARAELALPGALFLPEQASIEVALAQFPFVPEALSAVEGFDLAAFVPHLHSQRYAPADHSGITLRSAPARLMTFDFAAGDPPATGTAACDLISTGGMVSGLVQWLRLRFAEDIAYENRPGSAPGLHWVVNCCPRPARMSAAGERYRAGAAYASNMLALWCEPDGSE